MTEAETAVARGIALLDEKLGDRWDERIDLERLDIADVSNCICAQISGAGYLQGVSLLGFLIDSRLRGVTPSDCGFNRFRIGPATISELNASWRAAILRRRAEREAAS